VLIAARPDWVVSRVRAAFDRRAGVAPGDSQ
jgi:hypothetical protein